MSRNKRLDQMENNRRIPSSYFSAKRSEHAKELTVVSA